MSFWDTQQDAENYQRDIYPQVSKKIEDAIEGIPMIRSFEVKTLPGMTFTPLNGEKVVKSGAVAYATDLF